MGKKEELRTEIIKLNDIILNQKALIQQLSEDNAGLANANIDLQRERDSAPPLGSEEMENLRRDNKHFRDCSNSLATELLSVRESNARYIAQNKELERQRDALKKEIHYLTCDKIGLRDTLEFNDKMNKLKIQRLEEIIEKNQINLGPKVTDKSADQRAEEMRSYIREQIESSLLTPRASEMRINNIDLMVTSVSNVAMANQAMYRLYQQREHFRNEVAEKDYYITQLEAALEASKVI